MKHTLYSSLKLLIICFAINVAADPFVPNNDSMILTILDSNISDQHSSKLNQLKTLQRKYPLDHNIAIDLARLYITMAKTQTDPRYYGLAHSIIKPWWNTKDNTDVMLIKANILEFDHKFSDALVELNKILSIKPHTQSLLMRANIYQVTGDYQKVTQDCTRLLYRASPLVSSTCQFSVSGFTSNSIKTNEQIADLLLLLQNTMNASNDIQLWVLGLAAESASLNNEWIDAEKIKKQSLAIKDNDVYILSLYADLLLKQQRFQECIQLLKPHINQTTLLVRYLVAEKQLYGKLKATHVQNDFDLRIREDDIKGDQRHLREYSFYQLYVQKNINLALKNALTNWHNQKELIDSLILYRAASVLGRQDIINKLSSWKLENNVNIDFNKQALRI